MPTYDESFRTILPKDPDIKIYQLITGQLLVSYEPAVNSYNKKYDREPLIHGLPVRREMTYFQHNYPLNLTALGYSSFVKCFFDINGPLTLNVSKLHLHGVHFWVVGDLLFKPIETTCPIEEIRITACDSSKPIKLDGTLDLNKVPKIDLEGLNAARINIKCRDLAKTLPVPPSSTLDQIIYTIKKIDPQQETSLRLTKTGDCQSIKFGSLTAVTNHNAAANYQLESDRFSVEEDDIIKASYKITVHPGGKMSLGWLNTARNGWYGSSELILEEGSHEGIYKRRVPIGETEASLVFRNYHLETPGQTTFTIEKIEIQQEPLLKLIFTHHPIQIAKEQDGATTVVTDHNAAANYQLTSVRFSVKEDSIIKVPYKITVQPAGQMSMGLLNTAKNGWYGSELILGEGTHEGIYKRRVLAGEAVASLVLRNYHLETPGKTTFRIEELKIQQEPLLKLNPTNNPTQVVKEQDGATTIVTDYTATASYQLESDRFSVKEDSIINVPYKITVQPDGQMSMGLLNTARNGWYGSELILGEGTHEGIYERQVPKGETVASLVFRNYHLETPNQTTFTIERIEIQKGKM